MEAFFLVLGFALPVAAYLRAARENPTPRRLIGAPALAGLGVGLCFVTASALAIGPHMGLVPWAFLFALQGAVIGAVGVAGRLIGRLLDRRI